MTDKPGRLFTNKSLIGKLVYAVDGGFKGKVKPGSVDATNTFKR